MNTRRTVRHRVARAAPWAALVLAFFAAVGFLASDSQGEGRLESSLDVAQRLEETFARVASQVQASVVAISCVQDAQRQGDAPGDLGRSEAFGSGFIIDPRGYVLTNHHLTVGCGRIQVRLHDQREIRASFVRGDATSDVAILKVEAEGLPALTLGDSDALRVGQWVVAVGNPFGLSHTVSCGIVSALKRRDLKLLPFESFIQTDAAIHPGNSGGPLVNLRGEVIGINTAVYTVAGFSFHGIGFAVPINLAKALAERWIDGKAVSYLGMVPRAIDRETALYFGLSDPSGVLVERVEAEGPANAGGLRPLDVIVRFAKETVRDENHLRLLVARHPPDEEVEVGVQRGREQIVLRLTPRAQPEPAARPSPPITVDSGRARLLGLTVTTLTADLSLQLGLPPGKHGVAVLEVDPESKAWQKGLRQGDIIVAMNEAPVHNVEDSRRELARVPGVACLHVHRGGTELGFVFLPR
jgi:serine protease Do